MSLSSMTGFARHQGSLDGWTWQWELKSVNGKGLDVRLRLPPGLAINEQAVRDCVRKAMSRGNVSVQLNLEQDTEAGGWRINHDLLEQLIATARSLAPDQEPRLDQLLSVRGVVEADRSGADAETEARDSALLASLEAAVVALAAARDAEGGRLLPVLGGLIDELEALSLEAGKLDAARPDARRARLKQALADLLDSDPPVTEERLAQELAMQAVKADIAEELDRLTAHIAQARELLASDTPAGRRLDFLCQEFNREANTLCSKSSDIELTRVGMEMKAVIDRFREQVQNIE